MKIRRLFSTFDDKDNHWVKLNINSD